jgi:hypothetical protein
MSIHIQQKKKKPHPFALRSCLRCASTHAATDRGTPRRNKHRPEQLDVRAHHNSSDAGSTSMCPSLCMYLFTYIRTYVVCMNVCIYIYICVCTYAYLYACKRHLTAKRTAPCASSGGSSTTRAAASFDRCVYDCVHQRISRASASHVRLQALMCVCVFWQLINHARYLIFAKRQT